MRADEKKQGKEDKAVVLLSGGLDSAVTLAYAKREGYRCDALTFRYGQRHGREIDSAGRIAAVFGVDHHLVVDLEKTLFTGSALTEGFDVPLDRSDQMMSKEIPVTYVPARNTVFLSLSLAYAEQFSIFDLFIGVNAVDYSGYPDCRPDFIDAFEKVANLGTKRGVEGKGCFQIHAPLIDKTKVEIIRLGTELGVDFSMTWSCYNPTRDGTACGRCDSCLIRRRAFKEAGFEDDPGMAGR